MKILKMKTQTEIITILILIIMLVGMAEGMLIDSVNYDRFMPGEESSLRIKIENNLDKDYNDVSLVLDFSNLPLSVIGSSEFTSDIDEDDSEVFDFTIKASSLAKPGDYEIPYVLKFENGTKTGKIGLTVSGNIDLSFSLSQEEPVINSQDKITLKIVNKGFADAKFASVKITPSGFSLLSEDEVYIGNIDSDDFETASFDAILTSAGASLNAKVEYRDFDNLLQEKDISLPLTVYSREKALKLGIIKKNNTFVYVVIVVVLIILYLVYRAIRKRMRRKKAEGVGR